MESKNLFKTLVFLVFFILVVNFLANTFYWYSSIWYLDMIMHFLGGFWIGLLALYLLSPKVLSLPLILTIFFLVLFVGAGWEVFEFFINVFIAKNVFNPLDTISDVFFDLAGGLCAILYILVPLKNQRTGVKD